MRTFTMTLMLVAVTACGDDGESAPDTNSPIDVTTPDTVADGTVDAAPDATDSADPGDVAAELDGTPEVTPIATCNAPASARIDNAAVPAGFCASVWAQDIGAPRGMVVADSGDVLVVERDAGRVLALWDDDGDGVSGADERAVLATSAGLNHGLAVHGGFLYASRDSAVFRWPYSGQRADLGAAETVIKGLPAGGGHSTRTLALDAQGRLYVSIGSGGNVDADSRRARVVRFDLTTIPSGGIAYSEAFVFADGLRNEVGLAFDAQGVLWGVQNGVDNLERDDLGGDISEDNPAEIVSRFTVEGAFHGYPYCWAEYDLDPGVGLGRGALWAHPNTMDDGTHDDAWCRANVQPPVVAMQGHSAPLGLTFYDGASFPGDYRGDLFVTFHGSWNRSVPTGYKVVHIDLGGAIPGEPTPFFEFSGTNDTSPAWPYRPVDVRVGKQGQLFVTSDASDQILVIGHE